MFDLNVQYRKENSDEHASFTMKCKSMPAVGDYVQYTGENALLVKRVYHIPKEIDQVEDTTKADGILFVEFVSDLSVSDF